ncbi:hypothetical protein C4D60_Mb01t09640 [Musa balbisiana]|uniref:Uncharacterized protein n=1 Tax=Musa balbisiana TaxID=52838 RepID=A0A4S8JLW3_MUSBA|nr:hypothetical protein C4D60_Mb01t09640 [Musa balbisiana]
MRGSRGGHGGCPREFLLTCSRSSSKERGTSMMKRVVSRDGSSGPVGRVEDIIACGRWSVFSRALLFPLMCTGYIGNERDQLKHASVYFKVGIYGVRHLKPTKLSGAIPDNALRY